MLADDPAMKAPGVYRHEDADPAMKVPGVCRHDAELPTVPVFPEHVRKWC